MKIKFLAATATLLKFELNAFILGGQMGESEVLSAYNEIGSSDFARVIQYSWLWDKEERDQWER